MSCKNKNRIMNSLWAIGEEIKQVDIAGYGYLDIIKSNRYLHIFDSVKDFRQAGKISYKLSDLLMMAFLVILENGKGAYFSIADYLSVEKDKYTELGLIHDGNVPSHDTFRRIFELLDADSLYSQTLNAFYHFLQDLEKSIPRNKRLHHYSVDGKVIRGSGRVSTALKPQANLAMLNIYDDSLMTCFCSEPIDAKTNEIPVSQKILSELCLSKVAVTADALHCQKETAKIISKKRGIYVLAVKENQSGLFEEMKTRFTSDKYKVRSREYENRFLEYLFLPKGYATDGFTGMKVFIKMTSHKRKTPCIRYFISNSDDEELIAEAIDSRWEIEDAFHKRKDEVLNEDCLRSTNKNALHNLALINNLIISLINLYAAISKREFRHARIYISNHPNECLNTILAVMDSQEIIEEIKSRLRKS